MSTNRELAMEYLARAQHPASASIEDILGRQLDALVALGFILLEHAEQRAGV